jgi:hypothetical protein
MAREVFGERAAPQAYLTLSEVIGHLNLLLDAGVVAEVATNGVPIRFALSG